MRKKTKSSLIIVITLVLLWTVLRPKRPVTRFSQSYDFGWIKPNVYKKGDKVDVIINKVVSETARFPYGYYDLQFVCPPSDKKKPLHLSLNEIIRGDRKWESDYNLAFGERHDCLRLCDRKTKPEGLKQADALIRQGYVAHWLIDDDLPAATTFAKTKSGKKFYTAGFPLGEVDAVTGKTRLYNHLMLVVRYQTVDVNKHTIIGFEVYPKSVSDAHCPGANKDYQPYEINTEESEITYIPFTYSIYWREESNIDWSHRWNFFIHDDTSSHSKRQSLFHWISLANSAIVVVLMSLFIATIFVKIKNDDTVSSSAASWVSESTQLLSCLNLVTSMGVQFLFGVVGSLVVLCSLNKLHNIQSWVLSSALCSFVAGAYSSSLLGSLLASGPRVSLGTSVISGSALPGLVLFTVLVLNGIVWLKDSSSAIPFGTVVVFVAGYFMISFPLSLLGGFSARKMKNAAKLAPANAISKSPFSFLLTLSYDTRSWPATALGKPFPIALSNPILLTILAGIAPFVVICVELFYVYKSMWLQTTNFYYLYGFLLVNFMFLCIIVCEVSLLVCYVLMVHNHSGQAPEIESDPYTKLSNSRRCSPITIVNKLKNVLASIAHHLKASFSSWRWKSFVAGGSVAWYLELYSLYYLIFVLHLRDLSSILLFVCYTALFNFMCWCAFGALGYLSCLWFLSHISSSSKAH